MLKIYNSLSRRIEDFTPIHPPHVGMYTCGPTVYDYAHIGNFRTYTTADVLHRALLFNGYEVTYVMNITDVGHLTGDNLGDADIGEDRMEKSAKREGKSAWDIAKFYTEAFLRDAQRLHLLPPTHLTKATDHVKEQIDLVKTLEEKGFTYKTSDGIYFDTTKFPDYGQLSTLDQIKEGARVEFNPEKHNPRDFALWKFSFSHGRSFDSTLDDAASRRQMEWDSPWGKGFPGWHIECSTMSMKYLGTTFDLHTGGVDLRSTHHPNEIAQSEAATGKQFVKYWVHGAFILVDGRRMSKSLGNNFTVQDILNKSFHPLALRYLYLQTHYRQEMNFTWEALEAAQNALDRLYNEVALWDEPNIGCAEFDTKFKDAVDDDLNTPQALSIVWELVKSEYPSSAKAKSLFAMDAVLGLSIKEEQQKRRQTQQEPMSDEIATLLRKRDMFRQQKKFKEADAIRDTIQKMGYTVSDTPDGKTAIKKTQ